MSERKYIESLNNTKGIILKRIAKLEAELKWLQNQHVRVCSKESKLKEAISLHWEQKLEARVDNVDRRLWKALEVSDD